MGGDETLGSRYCGKSALHHHVRRHGPEQGEVMTPVAVRILPIGFGRLDQTVKDRTGRSM